MFTRLEDDSRMVLFYLLILRRHLHHLHDFVFKTTSTLIDLISLEFDSDLNIFLRILDLK